MWVNRAHVLFVSFTYLVHVSLVAKKGEKMYLLLKIGLSVVHLLPQTINFYSLGPLVNIVDMPGYGFAFAKAEKAKSWHELVWRLLSYLYMYPSIYG